LLLDLCLPQDVGDGCAARDWSPRSRCALIVLSGDLGRADLVRRRSNLGARGLLLKDAATTTLFEAIVVRGGRSILDQSESF
jgi:DNA-binding NarL/FixJ family response regulator